MENIINESVMKYIAKGRHEAVAEAYKGFDGYEIILSDGYVWDGNNTMFISETVSELRRDQQLIKYDPEAWEGLTGLAYVTPEGTADQDEPIKTSDTLVPLKEVVRVEQVIMERKDEYSFPFSSSRTVGQFGIREIGSAASEILLVAVVDTKNKINAVHQVFAGSLNTSVAHPREIFRTAILNNGARLFVFHNHPSGNTEPSSADLSFTDRLVAAGDVLGIDVIDHFIVTNDNYLSLREEGYM